MVGNGNALPSECSLCLSYAAGPITGIPAASRRGRIFLGPLKSDWLVGSAPARPNLGRVQNVMNAWESFQTVVGSDSLQGHVWSRTRGDVYPIVRAWMDDEFDTMRSRGTRSTTRVSVP